MKNRTVIYTLFGCGAGLGALPTMLLFLLYSGPIRRLAGVLLLPGSIACRIIPVTDNPHSSAGLFWITVLNAAIYGVVAAGVGWIVRRPRVLADNKCAQCSYDLTGNVSGVCPECGTSVEQDQSDHSAPQPPRDPAPRKNPPRTP